MDDMRMKLRTARIIGASMLAVMPMYLLIEEIYRAKFSPFLGLVRTGNKQPLRFGFYAAAAAVIVVLRLVNGWLLRPRPETDRAAVLQRLMNASIVSLSLADMPALLGLALFFLGGFNRDFYILLGVSLILMFMYFPRPNVWEARLRNFAPGCPF